MSSAVLKARHSTYQKMKRKLKNQHLGAVLGVALFSPSFGISFAQSFILREVRVDFTIHCLSTREGAMKTVEDILDAVIQLIDTREDDALEELRSLPILEIAKDIVKNWPNRFSAYL